MDCPKCGASTPGTQAFCGRCGASLQPAAANGQPASPAADAHRAVDGSDASTRFAPHKPDALESGTTYARAFYHLGVIAEQQGNKALSREQFRKFLELWKDADKGLPEVADARKRMAQ